MKGDFFWESSLNIPLDLIFPLLPIWEFEEGF